MVNHHHSLGSAHQLLVIKSLLIMNITSLHSRISFKSVSHRRITGALPGHRPMRTPQRSWPGQPLSNPRLAQQSPESVSLGHPNGVLDGDE